MWLQIQTIEDPARFQVLPVHHAVLDEDVRMWEAFFGQRYGTAVCVECAIFQNTVFRGVKMPVEKYVARLKQGGHVCVEQVSVGQKQRFSVEVYQGVIRHYGELQHHLIDFAVAIPAHAGELVLDRVEHFKYLAGGILVGEIVAGAVVEQIAKQHEFIGALVFKRG